MSARATAMLLAPAAGRTDGIAPRILAGTVAGIVFLGGFSLWAALAPIKSAAIATGVVKVETTRKTLQHLEGGVLREILVAEGARVAAGQVLLRLDATKAQANVDALTDQLMAALTEEARLRAEFAGRDAIDLPEALARQRTEPRLADILAGQERILHARRAMLQAKIAVVEQRSAQSRRDIEGLKAQEAALVRQLALIAEETADSRALLAKGLERRPHLLALERTRADLEGRRGDVLAQIGHATQAIAEGAAQVASLRNDDEKELADQLRDARARTADLRQQLRVAAEVLGRTELRAPGAGIVTDLKVHTPGGVIAPGETVMDLVPIRDRLVVEVRIRPEDIHAVAVGQPVQLRLPSYPQRTTPSLAAHLDYVSADRLTDPHSDEPYYLGRVIIEKNELAAHPGIRLLAGMRAEAVILTGETTVALYALSPVIDVFRHALRDR